MANPNPPANSAAKSEPHKLADIMAELLDPAAENKFFCPMKSRLSEDAARGQFKSIVKAIGPKYARCTVDNFNLYPVGQGERTKAQLEARGKIREWMEKMDERLAGGGGLLLWGHVGTGKDHLMAACMYHATLVCRYTVKWMEGTRLHQRLRGMSAAEYSEGPGWHPFEQEGALIDRYRQPQILAISDPIPPGRSLTPRGVDVLFSILDRRYRDGKSTWATLNVASAEDAERGGAAALIDRLRDHSLVIKCNWDSYRAHTALR